MELGIKGCSAAKYNMCVEPNGDVIPCQSYYEPAGHILDDDWETIWNHPLFTKIRARGGVDDNCRVEIDACHGDVPCDDDGDEFFAAHPVHEGCGGDDCNDSDPGVAPGSC